MMSIDEDKGDEDMLNRSFIDPVFLQQFPLTRLNALEYFCRSPFYDLLSNNETLRMQGTSMSHNHLQRMTGIEFALGDDTSSRGGARAVENSSNGSGSGGRLFLVKKQRREAPSSVRVLSVYYILDGTVYQSPNLLHLMMTRYNKITTCLSAALTLSTDCVDYTHPPSQSTGDSGNNNNAAAAGPRRVFPVPVPAAVALREEGRGGDPLSEGGEQARASGKKRQKITDCRDFPSFNNCVSDMLTFVSKT